jgi:cytochrome c6
MDTEEQIAAFVWIQVGIITISQVLLVAFVAGFIVGHFLTGSDKVTTVSAQVVAKEELAEAKAEEAEPEEAVALAKQQEAEHAEQVAMAKQEREAKEAEAKEGEEGGEAAAGGEEEAGGEEAGGEEGGGESAMTAGKEIFTSNCGSCHTLSEAGTSGEVGPNLDQLKPEESLVEMQVTNGGGAMPSFKGNLSDTEITEVAEYVSSVAGTG